MLERGLVEELERHFAAARRNERARRDDAPSGVAQAIGFHEWGAYLRARGLGGEGDGAPPPPPSDDDFAVAALRREAVEAMKADTRRLARRQLNRCRRLERSFGWRLTYLDSTAAHAAERPLNSRSSSSSPCSLVSAPGTTPIRDRLNSFTQVRALVFGNYGECSADVHHLLDACATAVARKTWQWVGARNEAEARARVTTGAAPCTLAQSDVEASRCGCFAHAMHSVQGAARCANHRDAPRCRCTQVVVHRGARCTTVHGGARDHQIVSQNPSSTGLDFRV